MISKNYDKEDDITVDDIQPIFVGDDILKVVSMVIGTLVFLGFCTFIVYLKCRSKFNYQQPYLPTKGGSRGGPRGHAPPQSASLIKGLWAIY